MSAFEFQINLTFDSVNGPYSCKWCEQTFPQSRKADCVRHLNRQDHLGWAQMMLGPDDPVFARFWCPVDRCGQECAQESHYHNHFRQVHGEQLPVQYQRPFVCLWPGCGKTFKERNEGARHLRKALKDGSHTSGEDKTVVGKEPPKGIYPDPLRVAPSHVKDKNKSAQRASSKRGARATRHVRAKVANQQRAAPAGDANAVQPFGEQQVDEAGAVGQADNGFPIDPRLSDGSAGCSAAFQSSNEQQSDDSGAVGQVQDPLTAQNSQLHCPTGYAPAVQGFNEQQTSDAGAQDFGSDNVNWSLVGWDGEFVGASAAPDYDADPWQQQQGLGSFPASGEHGTQSNMQASPTSFDGINTEEVEDRPLSSPWPQGDSWVSFLNGVDNLNSY